MPSPSKIAIGAMGRGGAQSGGCVLIESIGGVVAGAVG